MTVKRAQPEIEPAQPIEETLKYKGKLKRTTIARQSYAECLEPLCDKAWTGVGAIGGSSNHSLGSGHQVVQHYQAAYVMTPVSKEDQSILANHSLEPIDIDKIASKLRQQVERSKVTPKKA